MHVDGGATRQAFMYPQTVRLADPDIIRNARLDPGYAPTAAATP